MPLRQMAIAKTAQAGLTVLLKTIRAVPVPQISN
jgi:hypothetical protein